MNMATSLLYISIDFGTAYSGYSVKCNTTGLAKNFRDVWWGQEYGIRSCKTPTCILFDGNEVDFGYAAMRKYNEGFSEDKKLLFFQDFKMNLYTDEVIQMNMEISAVNGGKMKAITVISESLRYLKNHALKNVKNFSTSVQLQDSDITWVLTVPAIWNDAAKHFMREAAKQAGLVTDSDPDRLIFALEPEAAAVYCKELPSDGFVGGEDGTLKLDQVPGTQFLTVDCGGGTIDVTVHEVLEGGFLKQVDQASGNGLGGQNIDRQLKSLLQSICGPTAWEAYVKQNAEEFQGIMYNFASAKCAEENKGFKFPCPFNLNQTVKKYRGEDMEKLLLQRDHGVSWKNGQIVISPEKLKSFFDKSLSAIAELLDDIMRKPGLNIKCMLLVGGYAMSKILQNFIKGEFATGCTILCPQHCQQAVMVGAAAFGSQPQIVRSRICPFTYGTDIDHLFDELEHKQEKKYISPDGQTRCPDLFNSLVKRGESIGFNETRDFYFFPITREQTAMRIRFFRSTRQDPKYVDDWGVEEIDSFTIPMPDTQGGTNRQIRLEVKFGFTEIQAEARNLQSGESERIAINFMSE